MYSLILHGYHNTHPQSHPSQSIPIPLPSSSTPVISILITHATHRRTREGEKEKQKTKRPFTTPATESQRKLVFPLSLRSVQRNRLCLVFSKSDATCFSLRKHALKMSKRNAEKQKQTSMQSKAVTSGIWVLRARVYIQPVYSIATLGNRKKGAI